MECKICIETFQKGLHRLSCGHFFCSGCISSSFNNNPVYPVKCWSDSCHEIVQDKDCERVFRGEDRRAWAFLRKKWQDNFDQFINKCQNLDCDGEVHNYEAQELRRFRCPKCAQITCRRCKATHLPGERCKDWRRKNQLVLAQRFTRDPLVDKKIREHNAMYCPVCGLLNERDGGCYGLKCVQCGTELCLISQKTRWGSEGHGDVSGGCGCTLSSPCHEDCTSCNIDNPGTVIRISYRQFRDVMMFLMRYFDPFERRQIGPPPWNPFQQRNAVPIVPVIGDV